MSTYLVIGATGMQGRIVTRDLIESGCQVVAAGRNHENLQKLRQKFPTIQTEHIDLKNLTEVVEVFQKHRPSIIINCAEGDWNLSTYQAALETGCNIIDLGSDIPTTRAQLALDREFKDKKIVAITGCGSTPGVNNIMLAYAAQFLDKVTEIEAGFAWNSNTEDFVVPFSMESIIEEFTQPAQHVEKHVWQEAQPMKTLGEIVFREAGRQKVFLVRHPETYTFYEYFKPKGVETVRFYAGFPIHSFNKMYAYIEGDAFKDGTVLVEQVGRVPLIELSSVLERLYPAPAAYEEIENLWVVIDGSKDGQFKRIKMECIVPTLPDWKEAGCNIDTGLPASIVAQMVVNDQITLKGSFAPEAAVPPEAFFQQLKSKQMSIWMNGERIF